MAMLATRERPAARDFVWPPPEDELDALEVVELRGLVPVQLAPLQPATHAPAASDPVPTQATWRACMPRLAAIAAMMLFAMSIGVLLGVRDARRSMTAGYSRLRESVVAVREYVEHVGTVPSTTTVRIAPTRPAITPARARSAGIPPIPSSPAIATPDSDASPGASPGASASAASPGLSLLGATTLTDIPIAMSPAMTPNTLPAFAAPPSPRAAAAAAVSAVPVETRVTQALARYQQAYAMLDARAAAASWPSVDVAALTRAFSNLKSQSLTFDRCTVDVASASTATASCAGSTTAVRQVGSATPVTRSVQWTFHLRRGGDDTWVIDNVTTTRP